MAVMARRELLESPQKMIRPRIPKMPMTSSLGCGIWGGNITNENVTLKHMMNYTWVSRPIPEDRPSEDELFGEFFGQEVA